MEAIKAYLEQIKGLPVLKKQEEIDLITKAKQGNKGSRRKVINCNLKLVVNIAKHYSHFHLSLMDLIVEGNIGLMRAIDKFDVERGYRFSTYAAWWIRQAITRSLIDQGKTIRVPVYMSEVISKYKKARERLRQKLNREPNRNELAKSLKLPIPRIGEIELWMQGKTSLDAPVGGGDSQLSEFITSEGDDATAKSVNKILNSERVKHLLNTVTTKREKIVLDLRFGINNDKTATLAEISKELNISRERVRQIEKEALKKLQRYTRAEQAKGLNKGVK